MRVSPKDCDAIYDTLASDVISDADREAIVRYLIEGFVEKHHYKIDSVGFVSGRVGTTTFGITKIEASNGSAVRQALRSLGVTYNQQILPDDPNALELLFDLADHQIELMEEKLSALGHGYELERISVLPNWAKKFLRQFGGKYQDSRSKDKYGRAIDKKKERRDFDDRGGRFGGDRDHNQGGRDRFDRNDR